MKTPFKLLALISCFLFMCSIARAGIPSKEQFDFLTHYQNTSLVESALELTKSATELSLSTLMNTGVWYLVCKSPEFASGIAQHFGLEGSEKDQFKTIKADFCLQLASVTSAAEVTLVGHVSPWPLEPFWWQSLRFAGAGLAAYVDYKAPGKQLGLPLATLIFMASEATARTVSSTVSTKALRTQGFTKVLPEYYVYGEYTILSFISGLMVGGVVHEAFIHKEGIRPARAAFVSLVSAAITGVISGIVSTSMTDRSRQLIAGAIGGAGAAVGAGAVIIAGAGAGAGVRTLAGGIAGGVAGIIAGALAGGVAGIAGAAAGAGARARAAAVAITEAEAEFGAIAAIGAGVEVGVLLMIGSSETASNNSFNKVGVILAPALSLALINSLSNYIVYGYPLEQGLSDTAWILWKKFYAPLDYLSPLLN